MTASAENAEDASARTLPAVQQGAARADMCACRRVRRLGGLRVRLFGFGRAFGFRLRLRVDAQRRDIEHWTELSSTTIAKPTFNVPEEVRQPDTETYEGTR